MRPFASMTRTLPVTAPESKKSEASPSSETKEEAIPTTKIPESQPTATSKKAPDADCGCGPPPESGNPKENRSSSNSDAALSAIPTAAELLKVGELPLFDAEGKSHTFKSIYGDPSAERHLIIFVRHFFCTICQEYLKSLSTAIPPASISSLSPPTKLTIIGCGAPELLSTYIKETGLGYPMYTDPTATVYKALNLGRTLDMGNKKPAYIGKKGMWAMSFAGAIQTLRAGRRLWQGGDWWQIGGEFLFVRGEGEWGVKWCHRMKTTRDHAEVEDLKGILGLDG